MVRVYLGKCLYATIFLIFFSLELFSGDFRTMEISQNV